MSANKYALIRGGGDLATGVAYRLQRAGIKVVITELAQPLAVRCAVSFSEAVYEGHHTVEGMEARLIEADQLSAWDEADAIPVIIDPNADILSSRQFSNSPITNYQFPIVIDARLLKTHPAPLPTRVPLHIGLGPGFTAGHDCDAVIETRRSPTLGRVYWTGTTQPDSGEPEGDPRRVLRAPEAGVIVGKKKIGEHIEAGETIAVISNRLSVVSPFAGVLRGLIRDGIHVAKGLKIGDVDARGDVRACFLVSDKALAIGGGALEALMSRGEIRESLFG